MKPLPVVLAVVLLSALAFRAIGQPVAAQGVTPAPNQHAEIRTAFPFLVKDSPIQLGWRVAEYKDEYGRQYYKADALPGCGLWLEVPGDARPGLLLTPNGKSCPGFEITFGVLYWFSMPFNVVTPSPALSPPPASVTPLPSVGATATSTATLPAVVTSTPSPQGEVTPTHPIVTITPTPMFPRFPTCTTQILIYWAGDPAQGRLGGKVGSVSWCATCNSGCGMWMFGVDKPTLDGWTSDANERVHELWATATAEARR